MKIKQTGVALAALACMLVLNNAQADAGAVDKDTLLRIRDAAMGSDYAYQRLTDLTDLIGPRLSGSPGARLRASGPGPSAAPA